MRIFFLISCCFLFAFNLSAQKKLKDSVEVLLIKNDSLTYKLAEARREWVKCRDRQNEMENSLSASLEDFQKKGADCKQQLKATIKSIDSLKTRLEQTVALNNIIQKRLAAIDADIASKNNKALQLIGKIKDSLSNYDPLQLHVYEDSGNVLIVISDTLLLNGRQYLTKDGRMIIEKICSVLQNEKDRFLKINVYANSDTRKSEIWRICNIKSAVIVNGFESFDFPTERLSLQSLGYWKGAEYKIPPVVLELNLE